MKSSCKRTELASGGAFRIDKCFGCGTINMHIGAFTLRLEPAAMEQLATVLGEASAEHRRMSGQKEVSELTAEEIEIEQLEQLGLSLARSSDLEKIIH